jgi:hypothetical protein
MVVQGRKGEGEEEGKRREREGTENRFVNDGGKTKKGK